MTPPPHTHTHYYFILQHYPIFFSSKHLKPALCDFGRLFLIFFSGKVFRVFPIFVRMLVCLLYTVCKVIYLEKLIDSNTQQKHQIEHLQKELKIFLLWFILQTRNQFFSNSNLGGTQWCSGQHYDKKVLGSNPCNCECVSPGMEMKPLQGVPCTLWQLEQAPAPLRP